MMSDILSCEASLSLPTLPHVLQHAGESNLQYSFSSISQAIMFLS